MTDPSIDTQQSVLLVGDLGKLTPDQRLQYYLDVCTSLGLNPLTRPFEFQTFTDKRTNISKTILYARKDCTEQLRKRDGISISIVSREIIEGCYVVTARASTASRMDESIGAVSLDGWEGKPLTGEAKANAMMKAETKAKRRVTLSLSGLGILDETEVDTIVTAGPPLEPFPQDKAAAILRKLKPVEEPAQGDGKTVKTTEPPVGHSDIPPHTHIVIPPDVPTPDPQPEPMHPPAFIWDINGKHKGESIVTMDHSYLTWFVENGKNEMHVEKAKEELTRRRGLYA